MIAKSNFYGNVLELVVFDKSSSSSKVMITFIQMSVYLKTKTGEKYTHVSVFCYVCSVLWDTFYSFMQVLFYGQEWCMEKGDSH